MFENFTELHHITGRERLSHLKVYYDFDWVGRFGHKRAAFPGGQSLARLVKKECPNGKTPALILTEREDAEICSFEDDTNYCVVVKIKDYLANPGIDFAGGYFARENDLPLTRSGELKRILGDPRLLAHLIADTLRTETNNAWTKDKLERWQQLTKLVEFENTLDSKTSDDVTPSSSIDEIDGLLKKIGSMKNLGPVISKLMEFETKDLDQISSLVGIVNLKKLFERWELEKHNNSEEFWQNLFTLNPAIISQLFSYPCVIIAGKAYVGGKTLNNTEGHIPDMLFQNQITTNVMIVEIKTPETPLLSSKYRNVFSLSTDLSGAVNQVLDYKKQLQHDYYSLFRNSKLKFEVIDPKCLLIVGSLEEGIDDEKIKSFEIFRSDLKSVEIVTFDELFAKIQLLVKLLERSDS